MNRSQNFKKEEYWEATNREYTPNLYLMIWKKGTPYLAKMKKIWMNWMEEFHWEKNNLKVK